MLGTALLLVLLSRIMARHGESTSAITIFILASALTLIAAAIIIRRLAQRVRLKRWLLPFTFNITREGALYILAVFLLSLAAINTGNNLLFLVLATLLSTIIISGILSRNSLRLVSLSLQVPENVFVGERVAIKVSMKNMKRIFPSFSVHVENLELIQPASSASSSFSKKLAFWKLWSKTFAKQKPSISILHHSAYFPILRPKETRSELVIQSFPRRGPYLLEGFWISTCFPFGFFRRGQRIQAQGEVLVYPSVQEVSSFFHLLPFLPGKLEGQHIGPGESLFAIRKYQEGESARIVDWKATAKTGELMAREYAREEESKFCLILDTLIHPPPPADFAGEFEKAVSLAASLAIHFCEEGAELEFLTPHQHVLRGVGADHLYSILRSLAIVRYEVAPAKKFADLWLNLSGILDHQALQETLSDKVFKIIITSKPRGSFPSAIWRSSHVVYFDEL